MTTPIHERRGILSRFLSLVGRHELAVLLGFAGLVCGIWLFVAISEKVMEGGTRNIDRRLLLSMRHPNDLSPIGPPVVQDAARDLTALGGVTVLTLLTFSVGGYLFLDGKKHMALFVYVSVASGTLLSAVLKDLFQRPRPDIVPHEAYFSTSSFPSGHSMLSALTYLNSWGIARPISSAQTHQSVFSFVGRVADNSGRYQPCLSWSSLAHRCPCRMDRGRFMGDRVLAGCSIAAAPPHD